MKRFGSVPPSTAQQMDPLHLFHQRLYLIIIMVKAKLKAYPVGEYRRMAVLDTAAHLHKACARIDIPLPGGQYAGHLFKERVKLLCVMATAVISEDYPLGIHRREAILDNIETVVHMAFPKKEFPLYHEILMAA